MGCAKTCCFQFFVYRHLMLNCCKSEIDAIQNIGYRFFNGMNFDSVYCRSHMYQKTHDKTMEFIGRVD